MPSLHGMPVQLDKHLLKPGLTVYRPHRFVEYEESDRWWIEKYGFGHYEEHKVYNVGGVLVMHPLTLEKMKGAL